MKKRENNVKALTPVQEQAIRKNIFRAAHGAITNWSTFNWHRTNGVADAHVAHSSQAFCISVWGTIASDEGKAVRKTLIHSLNDDLLREALESHKAELYLKLE